MRAVVLYVLAALPCFNAVFAEEETVEPLTVVVMDPLAAPLACDCVQGYAQRKYERLAAYLQKRMGRRVDVFWSESLPEALKEKSKGKADLIIGKHSVVKAGAAASGLKVNEIARLSGRDGSTTQHGLLVVRSEDPAKSLKDLKGYRIFFGPSDCDEKSAAPMTLLRKNGIDIPPKLETYPACSEAAMQLLDLDQDARAVAVISSYAEPLLQGCGTIEKGDLRVVGKSETVPFVCAFVDQKLPSGTQQQLQDLLLKVGESAALLIALETDHGFERPPAKLSADWPCWRGSARDAIVPLLPEKLPESPNFAWDITLAGKGIGGISAAHGVVMVGGRDVLDAQDVFQCIDQNTGEERWRFGYPARGKLDYGNSPRATPVISSERVFLQGAFGHLNCVSLETGELQWSKHFVKDFQSAKMTWGHCGSPLLVPRPDGNDLLIIQPGGKQAAIVAVDSHTGDVVWKSAGRKAGYGSFAVKTIAGRPQLIGFDETTLGGWDAWNGKRLWSITPDQKGDFNVQTPVVIGDSILVSTESNGTRKYRFQADGVLNAEPVATFAGLSPDSHTPVLVGDHVFGVADAMFCLSADNLTERWQAEDDAFYVYSSLIADDQRLLLMSLECELVLVAANPKRFEVLSRLKLATDGTETYSHPAIVGNKLFARLGQRLVRLDL